MIVRASRRFDRDCEMENFACVNCIDFWGLFPHKARRVLHVMRIISFMRIAPGDLLLLTHFCRFLGPDTKLKLSNFLRSNHLRRRCTSLTCVCFWILLMYWLSFVVNETCYFSSWVSRVFFRLEHFTQTFFPQTMNFSVFRHTYRCSPIPIQRKYVLLGTSVLYLFITSFASFCRCKWFTGITGIVFAWVFRLTFVSLRTIDDYNLAVPRIRLQFFTAGLTRFQLFVCVLA